MTDNELVHRIRVAGSSPRAVLHVLATFRTAIAVTSAVVVIGIFTGTVFRAQHHTVVNAVGFDLDVLKSGRYWTIPAATFIPARPGITWHLALFVLVGAGLLEYLAGSARALVTFFLTDWVSTPLTTLALWALAAAGSDTANRLAHTPDTGPSAAAFGTAAAALALLPRPWREASLAALFAFLASAFTFQDMGVAMAHLIAAGLGGGLGWFVWRRQMRRGTSRAVEKPPA